MLITSAAIMGHDLIVYSLPPPNRHHDIIRYMVETFKHPTPIMGEQGFIADYTLFVNRKDALDIAKKSGQILPGKGIHRELYTEDLW